MIKRTIWLVILIVLTTEYGRAQVVPPERLLPERMTVRLGNKKLVTVELKTAPVSDTYVYYRSFEWGGDGDYPPRKILASLSIAMGSGRKPVPLSAYADLSDPLTASLKPEGSDGCVLTIEGGDASLAYTAVFKFRGDSLVSRRVM